MNFDNKVALWMNYYKFFIGKKIFHQSFQRNALPLLKGRILDLGSGLGPFQEYLKEQEVISIDYTSKGRPMVIGSAMELPFKEGLFDGVICTEVLEHLPEPQACLREIARVLKAGGYVYITVPMTWYLHYEPHDYYRFTKYGLAYSLTRQRFETVKIERLGGLYAFIFMRLLESLFVMIQKIVSLVLPKRYRFLLVIPLTFPVSWLFYLLASVLDRFNKRDAFGWCAVGICRKEVNSPCLIDINKKNDAIEAKVAQTEISHIIQG